PDPKRDSDRSPTGSADFALRFFGQPSGNRIATTEHRGIAGRRRVLAPRLRLPERSGPSIGFESEGCPIGLNRFLPRRRRRWQCPFPSGEPLGPRPGLPGKTRTASFSTAIGTATRLGILLMSRHSPERNPY